MQAVEIQKHARRLIETHGDKAVVEAAQKAVAFERQGEKDEAQTWRRIEKALLQMRGPRSS